MTRMLHVPKKSIQFHYWSPDYLLSIISEYHLYICSLGVQLALHHPELYIGGNYQYSWQNYVNNMARQGIWADNIIIQAIKKLAFKTGEMSQKIVSEWAVTSR